MRRILSEKMIISKAPQKCAFMEQGALQPRDCAGVVGEQTDQIRGAADKSLECQDRKPYLIQKVQVA